MRWACCKSSCRESSGRTKRCARIWARPSCNCTPPKTNCNRAARRLRELQTPVDVHAPPAPARQRLLVRAEGDTGIVHVLGKRTTIGRIPANDLCIDADCISRHHAVVLVTDSSTVVEDLNSTNGVFVNDVRVTRHALRDGDLLTIGKTSFRYVLKPETAQA